MSGMAYSRGDHEPRRPGVIDEGAYLLLRLPWWPELVDELREIGRWDPRRRGWRIAWADADELGEVLAEYGLALQRRVLEQESRLAELRRELARTPAGARSRPPADPFRHLFAALPAQLRKPAYRALARALHPDVGGDQEAMKALTAAYSEGGFE